MSSLHKNLGSSKYIYLPKLLILFIVFTSIYGLIILFSAASGEFYPLVYRQLLALMVFLPIALIIAFVDIRLIYNFSYHLYLLSLVMLVIVHFFGRSAMGATRWLDLGIVAIQPSELFKISLILMLAKYFHDNAETRSDWHLLIPLSAAIFPIILVIKQPDLGTGIMALLVTVGIFFIIGVKIRYFVLVMLGGLASLPLIYSFLHDYQKKRILTFLNPERDPLGSGYNIVQSKIAIGSGGFWGKGLFSGTQSHLKFLPEYHTDFVFSFLMEELGFIGGILLLLLYLGILAQTIKIAINCRSNFASIVALGVAILFFSHVFFNIAMVMGMVPVVGIPLPFISYGRTMLSSMLIGFGLVMNASVNRQRKL